MAACKNSSTRDEDGAAALPRSGVRTATTRIDDNTTAGLYADVHAAAPIRNGAPYVSAGVGNEARNMFRAASFIHPGRVRAAVPPSTKNRGVRVVAQAQAVGGVRARSEDGGTTRLVDSSRPRAAAQDEAALAGGAGGVLAWEEEVMASLVDSIRRPRAAAEDEDEDVREFNLDDYMPTAPKNERAAPYTTSGVPGWDDEVMSSLVNSGRPDAAAQDEDKGAMVYNLDDYMPATAKNELGAAAEKGNTNSLELQHALGFAAGRAKMLSYPTQTTAAAVEPAADYYDSSEALPLVPQAFVDKIMTSGAAVAGGQDNISVAGMFIEPLRRGIAVLGISVASLAVAGMFTERLRRGIAVLSISAASLAVAELAAGEPTPAAAFGLFLIVGLSAVIIHEIGA